MHYLKLMITTRVLALHMVVRSVFCPPPHPHPTRVLELMVSAPRYIPVHSCSICLLSPPIRVLELIHEAKWLTRLDIAIPESAQAVLEQEGRFKKYRAHLELVLSEYRSVCKQVPESLQLLFEPHILHVQQQLQPGLSTLAWNSMNIGEWVGMLE